MKSAECCRGCMMQLKSKEGRSDRRLTEKFIYCTNIDSHGSDHLPQHFCQICDDTISLCYRFIRNARRADAVIRNIVNSDNQSATNTELNKLQTEVCVKVEEEVKEEYQSHDEQLDVEEKESCAKECSEERTGPCGDSGQLDSDYEYAETKPEENTQQIVPKEEFNDKEPVSPSKESSYEEAAPTEQSNYKQVVKNILSKARSRKIKSEDSPIECEYCHKSFTLKIWYKKHLAADHADNTDRKYRCKLCSKGFSRKDILKQHMVTHSEERPHACHACPKRFKMRKQLNLHLRMHRDQTQYTCHVCNATFQWKAVLTTHMKTHFEKKLNLCHLCGMGFTLVGNLAVHMRTHTGEKPFACAHCSFRCSMSSSLRRHERTHTGARPHACSLCHKSFSDLGSMKRHVRTHTGELPYPCHLCSRAFIDSGKRKRHVLSQHQVACREAAGATQLTHSFSDSLSSIKKNCEE